MSTNRLSETDRIREVYARRDSSADTTTYAWHRPDVLLNEYRFRAAVAFWLKAVGWTDLTEVDCLDVGCGSGSWLRTLREWGVPAHKLHGVDVLPNRIKRALTISPNFDFKVSQGWPIPMESRSMHLITANTVFSSILCSKARAELASEMARVLRPNGLIFIYDFRISDPRNPDTIGIRKAEIKRLFPRFELALHRLTLAPPVQRPLAEISPLLAHALEAAIPILCTHALFKLTPPDA